jgi:hypothetical protein
VEGIEFDARVEVIGETLHNARAEIGLGAASRDEAGDCEGPEQNDQHSGSPPEPAESASERCSLFTQFFNPASLDALASFVRNHFLIGRRRA